MLTITPLTLLLQLFCLHISTMACILNVAKTVRQPGIEPGSIAWEATMLTITPLTQRGIKLRDDVALNNRKKCKRR